MKTFKITVLIAAAIVLVPFCPAEITSPLANKELKAVTLACQWQPQAQFAGFYLAQEKGFYRRCGLEVNIIHADTTCSNTAMLRDNKAQFVTMFLASAIKFNSNEIPIVNIAQLFQHSSLLIVGRKTEIKNVRDLNNRRVGIWYSDFEDIPLQFLADNTYNSKVLMINSGINMFLFGGVDALTVTIYNEFHSLIMAGINPDELTVFRMSENDLDVPEDGIYCRRDYFEQNPQLCLDFAQASLEGWKYAAQHPDEALDLVEKMCKEYHLPWAKTHQKWMLNEVLKLIFPPDSELISGVLNRGGYYRALELLRSSGKIRNETRYVDFYRGNH